jgi:large subunit ribosomal protein L17
MRHQKRIAKLSRPADQRKALLRGIIRGLLAADSVKTTLERAKAAQPLADKMVTWAKRGDLHARRLALRVVPDPDLVGKLFAEVGPRFTEREGGYTQVIRAGMRRGDSSEMAVLRWTDK